MKTRGNSIRYNPCNIFEKEKKVYSCLNFWSLHPFQRGKGDKGVVTKEELLKFIEEENKENEEAQWMGYITWDDKMARRVELDLLYKNFFGEENEQ